MRVLIIGAGRIAERHLDRLKRIEGAALAGVCDVDPLRAAALGQKWQQNVPVFPDFNEAIRSCKADYLLLTTPRDVRLPIIEACVEHSLPVLMEKPPCDTLETGRAIESLLAQSRLLHSVGFMHRWHDALNLTLSLLGGPTGVRMMSVCFTAPLAVKLPRPPWPAPYFVDRSGGLIGDQGIHYIDLARYVTASEPIEIAGMARQQLLQDDPALSPDNACWIMQMGSGALVSHAHTWCSDSWRCEVVLTGQRGQVTIDMFANHARGMVDGQALEYAGQIDEFEAEHRGMREAVRQADISLIRSDYTDAMKSFATAVHLQHMTYEHNGAVSSERIFT